MSPSTRSGKPSKAKITKGDSTSKQIQSPKTAQSKVTQKKRKSLKSSAEVRNALLGSDSDSDCSTKKKQKSNLATVEDSTASQKTPSVSVLDESSDDGKHTSDDSDL